MRIERSAFTDGVLRIYNGRTLLINYHVQSRTFGYVEATQFRPISGAEFTVPEEIVAECLAYSITGKLKGES